jgi:hypothetical protein
MVEAAIWREKARVLRDRANETNNPQEQSVLLTLADDCDELAADREKEAVFAPPKAG